MSIAKIDTVFVGLSGGVDSSVAALRLKTRGYNVVGVFIKVWHPEWMVCNWEQERLDAMRVAAHLDIPFLTCDAEAVYRDGVADYFIKEYEAGRTPNPDVMCNQQVKFGAFWRFASTHGADYIATGHYAQRVDGPNGSELYRGIDENKDQSYFLWTLTDEQLKHSLFPVGDTPKSQIRTEATTAAIPTAAKKDSQGICFLGHIDISEFLSHYVDLIPGQVLDETGTSIGEHQGALVYTIGQRHGFTLTNQNEHRTGMYVLKKDLKTNTITVGPNRPYIEAGDIIILHDPVLRQPVAPGDMMTAQCRYRQTPFMATVIEQTEDSLTLRPDEATDTPVVGQSCVLYRNSLCVGGGIIQGNVN